MTAFDSETIRKIRRVHEKEQRQGHRNTAVPLEEDEQMAVLEWTKYARGAMPELDLLFHPANGEVRHPATATKLKAMGVKPGVPDLVLPVARHGYHGLFIELKRRKMGIVSEVQEEWLAALACQGYRTVVCKGADQAIQELRDYLRREDPDDGAGDHGKNGSIPESPGDTVH